MASNSGKLVSFSEILMRLREKAGISESDLAEKTGLSRPTITLLQNGLRMEPRRNTISAIADALGVCPSVFFEKKESPKK